MNKIKYRNERKTWRLDGFDYSTSASYFITVTTMNRNPLFGEIKDGIMNTTSFGEIVNSSWKLLENRFENIKLDVFQVMPDHFHGIVNILQNENEEDSLKSNLEGHWSLMKNPKVTLGKIVRHFKARVTREINRLNNNTGFRVWENYYYDRIIRNEKEFLNIQNYIVNNPLKDSYKLEALFSNGAILDKSSADYRKESGFDSSNPKREVL